MGACKNRGAGEQRRCVLGLGENHVVEEVCRNALCVEGQRDVRKGREGYRHKGRDIWGAYIAPFVYTVYMFLYVLVVPNHLFFTKNGGSLRGLVGTWGRIWSNRCWERSGRWDLRM